MFRGKLINSFPLVSLRLSVSVASYKSNSRYLNSYSQMINRFTKDFANHFCLDSGEIDWDKLVQYNSSAQSKKDIKKELNIP